MKAIGDYSEGGRWGGVECPIDKDVGTAELGAVAVDHAEHLFFIQDARPGDELTRGRDSK